CERHGSEPQLEQPATSRRLEVVVPLWNGLRDALDLARVESQLAVQADLAGSTGVVIRQIDLRRTRVEYRMPEGKLCELRRALSCQHDGRVLLAQSEQPLMDARSEQRVHQRHPRFVDLDQRRTSIESAFDTAEEVEKNWNGDSIVQRQQMLQLEYFEAGRLEIIGVGVAQLAVVTGDGVRSQCRGKRLMLDLDRQLCQRAMPRLIAREQFETSIDARTKLRCDRQSLKPNDDLNPVGRPCAFGRLVNRGERLETKSVRTPRSQVVMQRARGRRQHPHRVSDVENEHLRAGVASELRREEPQ